VCSARGYEFGDPSEILERRQRIKAREIAELIFKLPEAMWEDKLSLMKPEWREDVREYLSSMKQRAKGQCS
jgi:hypothetical protein